MTSILVAALTLVLLGVLQSIRPSIASFLFIFFLMSPAPLSGCKDLKLSKTNRTYHTYTPNTRACVPGSLTIHMRDTRAYVSGVCPSVLGSCHTRAMHGRVLKPCVLLWISSAPYTGVYICGTAVYDVFHLQTSKSSFDNALNSLQFDIFACFFHV
mgnify:CR=1 FL=1